MLIHNWFSGGGSWVIWEEMRKKLTASQNKKTVYVHEGCILKIEGATGV